MGFPVDDLPGRRPLTAGPGGTVAAPTAALSRARAGSRLEGVDALRALAMIGMVIAHYVERSAPGSLGDRLRAFVDGRAMPTFVVLAGVGISLLVARARHPDRELLARALLLFPAGLALQEATTVVAVILQYYAVYFVLAVVFRRLPDAALLLAALVTVLGGGVVVMVVGPRLPGDPGWDGWGTITDPGLWSALFVNGYYPVLPTIAFVLVGMWLGRRPLGDRSWPRRLVVAGLVVAAIGYGGGWAGRQVFARPADDAVAVDTSGRVSLVGPEAGAIAAASGADVGQLEADANGRPTEREAAAALRAPAPGTGSGRRAPSCLPACSTPTATPTCQRGWSAPVAWPSPGSAPCSRRRGGGAGRCGGLQCWASARSASTSCRPW